MGWDRTGQRTGRDGWTGARQTRHAKRPRAAPSVDKAFPSPSPFPLPLPLFCSTEPYRTSLIGSVGSFLVDSIWPSHTSRNSVMKDFAQNAAVCTTTYLAPPQVRSSKTTNSINRDKRNECECGRTRTKLVGVVVGRLGGMLCLLPTHPNKVQDCRLET